MAAIEPTLPELRKIMRKLMTQESTKENMAKIYALDVQIKRHEDK